MWTYQWLKDTGDPYLFGTLIKQRVRCGKSSCKCVTKGEKHEAHYLKWRDKNPFTGVSTMKKKHIKKADVESVRAKLELYKGTHIMGNLNHSQIEYALSKFPHTEDTDMYRRFCYRVFKKPPYPHFPNDPLTLMLKGFKLEHKSLNKLCELKYGKKSRKEYLRKWRWDKKRKEMGLPLY